MPVHFNYNTILMGFLLGTVASGIFIVFFSRWWEGIAGKAPGFGSRIFTGIHAPKGRRMVGTGWPSMPAMIASMFLLGYSIFAIWTAIAGPLAMRSLRPTQVRAIQIYRAGHNPNGTINESSVSLTHLVVNPGQISELFKELNNMEIGAAGQDDIYQNGYLLNLSVEDTRSWAFKIWIFKRQPSNNDKAVIMPYAINGKNDEVPLGEYSCDALLEWLKPYETVDNGPNNTAGLGKSRISEMPK